MPDWASVTIGLIITCLFVSAVFGLGATAYGDWVRRFYAKRDKLQTLFSEDNQGDEKRKSL